MHTQGETRSRTARRWRSGPWRSPRFLLGLALVFIATALGGWLITSVADDDGYWALRGDVRAGEPVRDDQLVITQARLDDTAAAAVLPSSAAIEPGAVWARDVSAGALVPADAWVAEGGGEHELPVSVREGAMPGDLAQGDHVDVWVGPGPQDGGATEPAERVLAEVRVARVDPAPTGGMATVVVTIGDEPPSATTVAAIGSGHVTMVRRT